MNNTIVGIVQLIALRLWRVGAIPIHSSISWMEETPVGLPDSLQAHHRTNESLRINACFEGARSAQWLAPKLLCRKKSGAARIILASTLQAGVYILTVLPDKTSALERVLRATGRYSMRRADNSSTTTSRSYSQSVKALEPHLGELQ